MSGRCRAKCSTARLAAPWLSSTSSRVTPGSLWKWPRRKSWRRKSCHRAFHSPHPGSAPAWGAPPSSAPSMAVLEPLPLLLIWREPRSKSRRCAALATPNDSLGAAAMLQWCARQHSLAMERPKVGPAMPTRHRAVIAMARSRTPKRCATARIYMNAIWNSRCKRQLVLPAGLHSIPYIQYAAGRTPPRPKVRTSVRRPGSTGRSARWAPWPRPCECRWTSCWRCPRSRSRCAPAIAVR